MEILEIIVIILISLMALAAVILLFPKLLRGDTPEQKEESVTCACGKCKNGEECENKDCQMAGRCSEINRISHETLEPEDTQVETTELKIDEIITEPVIASPSELSLQEGETPPAETWEGKDVKRDVMLELLKTANVKGISKLSKAELRAKCIEMGIICPV